MFNEPGKKLKSVANALFVISSIGCIILACVLGISTETNYYFNGSSHTSTDFNAGLFFGILIGGIILSYVECLVLSGLGELIENSKRLHELKNIYEVGKAIQNSCTTDAKIAKETTSSKTESKQQAKEITSTKTESKQQAKETTSTKTSVSEGRIVCKMCWQEQAANRQFCSNCGAKLI